MTDKPLSDAERALRDAALEYHRSPSKGKIAVTNTLGLGERAVVASEAAELEVTRGVAGVLRDLSQAPYHTTPQAVLSLEPNDVVRILPGAGANAAWLWAHDRHRITRCSRRRLITLN